MRVACPAPHQALAHRATRPLSVSVRASSATAVAANPHSQRRPQNVAGDFWVDQTCIDCDTCRWMCPSSFGRADGQSAVHRQPEGHEERVRAMQALLSCPTFSIHTDHKSRDELQEAQQGLPALVPGVEGVYHCGWHSENSFGAASYLVRRPDGNVLVDSPRYNPVLARQIEALGGVRYIFLTHKDDVADHDKWAKHFQAVRILHQGELRPNTANVEIKLEGAGPWPWSHVTSHPATLAQGRPADQSNDFELVLTPGHTSHHVCMYHRPSRTLFSGDHLSSPEKNGMSDRLYVFKDFCWYDFETQLDSVPLLLQYDWLHVLAGHGRQVHLRDDLHRLQAVSDLMRQHGRADKHSVKV